MKDSKKQSLVWKPWRIKTTSQTFYNEYRDKTCTDTKRDASGPTDHQHIPLVGAEATRSAFYPEGMCPNIAKFWTDEPLPGRTIALHDLAAILDILVVENPEDNTQYALQELPA